MSCHQTNGGLLSLRLARAYSGLEENRLQVLYHELKREGAKLPAPTEAEFSKWKSRQLVLIEHAPMKPEQKTRSELDLFLATYEDYNAATFYAWKRLEVRSRQEAVLSTIQPPLVEIEPKGSQWGQYDLDEEGRPNRIWYASYGSNLSRSRFMSYVNGTVPEGLITSHPGCRDTSEPTGDIAMSFPGRMHFAGKSSRWGGGGASFVDASSVGKALGRAYNISMQQFDDVIAQENRQEVGSIKVNIEELLDTGKTVVNPSLPYGTLVHVGDYLGAPVVTLTSSFSAQKSLEDAANLDDKGEVATRTPNSNYLRTIGLGLKEAFNMNEKQQADYLRGAPGAEDITRTEMIKILTTPIENREQRFARLAREYELEREGIARSKESLITLLSVATDVTPKLEQEIARREEIIKIREEYLNERVKKLEENIRLNEARKAEKLANLDEVEPAEGDTDVVVETVVENTAIEVASESVNTIAPESKPKYDFSKLVEQELPY